MTAPLPPSGVPLARLRADLPGWDCEVYLDGRDTFARAERDGLAALCERMRALLHEHEWASAPHRDEGMCYSCCGLEPLNDDDRAWPHRYGHRDGCPLFEALALSPADALAEHDARVREQEREACAVLCDEFTRRVLAAKDRALAAGRENVASHRQSDAETSESLAQAIRARSEGGSGEKEA